jgi:hypothetical protein
MSALPDIVTCADNTTSDAKWSWTSAETSTRFVQNACRPTFEKNWLTDLILFNAPQLSVTNRSSHRSLGNKCQRRPFSILNQLAQFIQAINLCVQIHLATTCFILRDMKVAASTAQTVASEYLRTSKNQPYVQRQTLLSWSTSLPT